MDTWKRLWRSPWRTALFAGAGALAGVAYYEFVGCRAGGSCAITSSAWRSAAYFALVGAVVGWQGRPAPAPAPAPDDRPKDP
jgi:hypothetical protein